MNEKTLGDYIKQMQDLENTEKKPLEEKPNLDQYLVYPEDDGYDTPKNPYGNH